MNFPSELKYTNDHEWLKIDGDIAYVGVTDFAQNELGDIVYIEVDTVGDSVNEGDVFGTIEAVKTVSDLFIPVDAEIIEFNSALEDAPEKVNEAPYKDGWIVKIKISDASQINGLLSAEEYKALIGQ